MRQSWKKSASSSPFFRGQMKKCVRECASLAFVRSFVRSFVHPSRVSRQPSAWYSNVSSFAATTRAVARPRRLDVTAATRDDDVIDVVRPLRILVRVVGAVISAIIRAVAAARSSSASSSRVARVVVSLPLVVVVSLSSSSRAAGRPQP